MKLTTPRLRVTLAPSVNDSLTADPVVIEIQTDHRDQVAWEFVRHRKNWPPAQGTDGILALTVMAWSACKRDGLKVTIDEFIESCIGCDLVDEDGNLIRKASEVPAVNPTNPAAQPD